MDKLEWFVLNSIIICIIIINQLDNIGTRDKLAL